MADSVTTQKFIEDLGQRYERLVIAEKHYAPGNEKLYGDEGFYKGLHNAGFKYIGIELPPELQTMINAYSIGDKEYFRLKPDQKLTPEAMYPDLKAFKYDGREYTHVEVARDLAVQIEFAKKYDLKLIAMDDKKNLRTPSDADFAPGYLKEILDKKGITEPDVRKQLQLEDSPEVSVYDYLSMTKEEQPRFLDQKEIADIDNAAKEQAQAVRMRVDQNWVSYLDENLPPGARVAAIIGLSHPSNIIKAAGIDELLGGDQKVATIEIYKNQQALDQQADKMAGYSKGGLQAPQDKPHAVLFLDTMAITPGEKLDIPGYEAGKSIQVSSKASEEVAPATSTPSLAPAPK